MRHATTPAIRAACERSITGHAPRWKPISAFEIRVLVQVVVETRHVQADVGGVLDQVLAIEPLLVLEEHVVHGPKLILALRRDAFGCFSNVSSVWMLWTGEVSIDEAKAVAKAPPNFLNVWVCHAAEGAFEIAVFDQSHRCARRTQRVIALIDSNGKSPRVGYLGYQCSSIARAGPENREVHLLLSQPGGNCFAHTIVSQPERG